MFQDPQATNQPVTSDITQAPAPPNPTPTSGSPDNQAASTPAGDGTSISFAQNPNRSVKPNDMITNAPTTTTNPDHQDHPAVQRAGLLHSIAESLAGGPRYKVETDANSGETRKVRVPLSGREIGMAIALEAISGSLAGLKAGRGHGAGAAGVAGMEAGAQVKQQQQNLEDKELQEAQQATARHYQVAEANMRMLSLAQTVGRQDQEMHSALVANSASQLQFLKDNTPELIEAANVSEAEAKDLKKYPLNEFVRIPDGVVARLDPNGNQIFIADGKVAPEGTPGAHAAFDNTYSIVHQNAKVSASSDGVPAAWVQQAVAWGLLDKSWLKAADTAKIGAPLAATLTRKVDSLNSASADLARYYDVLNSSAKGKSGEPKYPPVDLRAEVVKDPTIAAALDKFQGVFNQTGSREAVIGELAKKDAKAAGKVARLYGGRDALHEYDMQQKAKDVRLANQLEIEKEKSLIPIKAAAAGAEEAARVAANPQNNDAALTTPDALGFTPHVPGGLKEYNKRQATFKKNSDDLFKSEGTFQQFQSIIKDINNGKFTGAQSVVGLFDAIGISATPLAGRGFRVNNNVIDEHAQARGWEGALQQKLLSVKSGDVITPQQLKDYADIAAQARESQYTNLVNQVHNQGLNADFVLPTGNGQALDQSTARIFLQLSGNDAAKAAAAAKTKGWVIQ